MANSSLVTPRALTAVITAAMVLALVYNASEAVLFTISSPIEMTTNSGGTEYAALPWTYIGSGLISNKTNAYLANTWSSHCNNC